MADLEDLLERAGRAQKPDCLARIWRRAKPGFTRELRMKDKGMLAQMIQACGGDAPRAARALVHVALNWEQFVAEVDALHGDGVKGPAIQDLRFTLAHFEVAVRLAEKPTTDSARISTQREKPFAQLTDELSPEAREEYLRYLEDA